MDLKSAMRFVFFPPWEETKIWDIAVVFVLVVDDGEVLGNCY